MKFGLRKFCPKKTLKAKTTGRAKRSIKREIDPFYGQSGVGYIKSPKRSIKNKIYKKTTFDIFKKWR